MEAQYVKRVIASVDGNMSRAAEILKVDRRTLYRMIERYGMSTDRLRNPASDEAEQTLIKQILRRFCKSASHFCITRMRSYSPAIVSP